MPLFLLVALFLAFGADSVVVPGVISPGSVPGRVGWVAGWVGLVAVLARLVSAGVEVRARRAGWRVVPGSRRLFRWGRKLVGAGVLGGYAWAALVLDWPEVVRSIWGLREAILVDEVLILAPFLLAEVAAWWGLARGDRVARAEAAALFGLKDETPSVARYVVTQARQAFGMVLPAAFLFAFGQDLARWTWPARAADPNFQMAQMVALGGLVLVLAPAFVRLSWPTRTLPAGPLRTRLERVAARFGFRYTDILVWEAGGGVVNAGVTGATPWFRYVLLADALLEGLNDHEIAAVSGHEVGHARHRHLGFFGFFFVGSVGVMTLIGASVGDSAFRDFLPPGLTPTALTVVQGGTVLAAGLVYFGVVFGHLSRRFERQADVFGARAVSCDQPNCPPHPDPYQVHAAATLAELDERAPICPVGLRTFINALRAVAALNGIDPAARSWRHGSIARRVAFLECLEGQPERERAFQAGVVRLRVALVVLLALALILAFETGAIEQLGA